MADAEPSPPSFPRVDALFAGEMPAPVDARRGVRRVVLLIAVAVPLNLAGVLCFTGVPGAALTLWAWLLADSEYTRIRESDAGPEALAAVQRARGWAAWNLGLCVLSLLAQAWLLTTNFYEGLLTRLLS